MGNNDKKIKAIVFILKRISGEMLLQLRDGKSEYYPNQWNFPGGRVETTEATINTVIREAKEEYNVSLEKNKCKSLIIYDLPHRSYQAEVFICEVDNKKLKSVKLLEGADMRWMNIDEIKKIKLGFGQGIIISELEKFINKKTKNKINHYHSSMW